MMGIAVKNVVVTVTLLGCVFWSGGGSSGAAHAAAKVEGFGSISTSLAPPFEFIFTEYEHPDILNVANTVQLNSNPDQAGPGGHETMSYTGQAQFGRLAATAFVGGTHANSPDLSAGVRIVMDSQDLITAQGLNPSTLDFLRLDVDLSGVMSRGDQIFGNLTAASFGITQLSPTNPESFVSVAGIEFNWSTNNFQTNSTTSNDGGTQGFVADPGEEPGFESDPGPGHFSFGARGYVDVPLDGTLGSSFLLILSVAADASTTTDNTFASSNFGSTALIGNARIVDQNGNIVQGASFTSESGYDYITPPAAIPEPQTCAMLLAALGLSGLVTRRRQRTATV